MANDSSSYKYVAKSCRTSVLGTMGDINWALINSRLPYARTKEQFEERRRMWRAIDVNDNGFVSLAEITRVWHHVWNKSLPH